MRGLLVALLLVVACDEHGKRPDGGADACGNSVNCGVGSHCEPHCELGSTESCNVACFAVCVPDHPTCPACTVDKTCGQTCTRGCIGEPEQCLTGCIAPSSCATLTTELACDARADCFVIRHGEGCTCDVAQACTCANPNGAFARCESIMP